TATPTRAPTHPTESASPTGPASRSVSPTESASPTAPTQRSTDPTAPTGSTYPKRSPGTETPPETTPPPGSAPNTRAPAPLCTAAATTVEVAVGQGAAGHVEYLITMTNTGDRPCTVQGYPGVSMVAGDDGTQVGAAA